MLVELFLKDTPELRSRLQFWSCFWCVCVVLLEAGTEKHRVQSVSNMTPDVGLDLQLTLERFCCSHEERCRGEGLAWTESS